jgi:hypothetical protein
MPLGPLFCLSKNAKMRRRSATMLSRQQQIALRKQSSPLGASSIQLRKGQLQRVPNWQDGGFLAFALSYLDRRRSTADAQFRAREAQRADCRHQDRRYPIREIALGSIARTGHKCRLSWSAHGVSLLIAVFAGVLGGNTQRGPPRIASNFYRLQRTQRFRINNRYVV